MPSFLILNSEDLIVTISYMSFYEISYRQRRALEEHNKVHYYLYNKIQVFL